MPTTSVSARAGWSSIGLGVCLAVASCQSSASPEASTATGGVTDPGSLGDGDSSGDGGLAEATAVLTHSFGEFTLAPREELQPCIQWTPNNTRPLYVQAVTIANDGGFHHSNWFIVPIESYPGDDGFFSCESRGFTELDVALSGTVLTAQSTQSRFETMALPPGVVVKIPPGHKIIAGGHMLNLADAELSSELRMSLELVHPRRVEVIATPFRLTYYDLALPGFTESRFSASCDLAPAYRTATGRALDLELYYVLPHYHYLGNFFDLTILGGPRDGESIFRLDGFNADANGQAYPEPVELSGARGFRFTCGYDNWTDQTLGWGIGNHEMCVMLGLANSAVVMDGSVVTGTGSVVGTDGEILLNEGPCGVLGLPKNPAQAMPSDAELDAPLYVPPSPPGDEGLPPVDDCVDVAPDLEIEGPATLSRVHDTLLVSTCQFSSCHAGDRSAAGLDLAAADLHAELREHEVQAPTDLPLVAPGDPEGSWLYRVVSECQPLDRAGNVVAHMPLNSPRLSDPNLVAILREWIAAGARNN